MKVIDMIDVINTTYDSNENLHDFGKKLTTIKILVETV